MRAARLFVPLLLLGAAPVHAQDTPALAARLIEAGAPELALGQARRFAGLPDADPAWRDVAWEAAGQAGKRLGPDTLPPGPEAPPGAWRAYGLAAAAASLEQGRGPQAREQAARVLWQEAARPEERREARRLVAESWLLPGQDPAAVNPVWLRLVQDHPKERARIEPAALRLLQSGQARHALRLLEGAGLEGPVYALAAYRLGQLGHEQAEARLRAVGGELAWQALAGLAEDRADRALGVEALERLSAASPEADPAALWEAYAGLAEQAANARHLLVGADAPWLEQAEALSATAPLEGRAMLAWLVREGRDEGLRSRALAGLAQGLVAAGLAPAAPRLLGGLPLPWVPMAPDLRHRLGEIAAAHKDYGLAVLLWEGVGDAPEAVEPRRWLLDRARVWIRAGRHDAAAQGLADLLGDPRPLPPDLAGQAVRALDALREAGRAEAVGRLARLMLPLVEPALQRQLWLVLGELAEGQGRAEEAAAGYLLAAGWSDPEALDELALEARRRALRQLRLAGLEADARRQDERLRRARPQGLQPDAPSPDAAGR